MASRVVGLDKLSRKLHELPDEMQLSIRQASELGAGEMVEMSRGLVPVDDGDLRDSIGWSHGPPPAGSFGGVGARAKAGAPGDDRISVYAGNAKAYYARWVEFGTVGRQASPYFFPAFRALKKRMKSRNTRAINKAIKKVAAGGK